MMGTGEVFLTPGRKSQENDRSYNRNGKWADGEKMADGLVVVAMKVGNSTGAKGPCFGSNFVTKGRRLG